MSRYAASSVGAGPTISADFGDRSELVAVSETSTETDGGRTLLVRTALDLLDHVHPEDLSVRKVARAAGLSSGAPYHHFANKTELLAACAVLTWSDLCDLLDDDGGGAPEQRLMTRASTYLRFARAHPGSYHLITSRLLDDDHRFVEIAALRGRAMSGAVELIISASAPALDSSAAKFRGVALWSLLHGHLTLDNELEHARSAELDGAVAELAARMALLS